jgi:hypothetical protein
VLLFLVLLRALPGTTLKPAALALLPALHSSALWYCNHQALTLIPRAACLHWITLLPALHTSAVHHAESVSAHPDPTRTSMYLIWSRAGNTSTFSLLLLPPIILMPAGWKPAAHTAAQQCFNEFAMSH